ncbi:DUF2254 domain-containing protein [Aetokthonos hydrillicola Thurmond2011]|jgi:pheromone shutdown protein TraB|uniref:DUF2254 domain-containing protein n=1 Tax=Aetokthonos hydrillicola Thurmond2011 TaxID=2712845 RepID=A0AAP5IDN0_9CYAN|nr:hypothetical protein [Aetokthonos hydrillicola]MBO3457980.1 DUF2254 domain-containing protein [Aetokthonos hydrillicola CCALA 1050]MBW4591318.1 DUF2254 domain-containing protein [Aetokthonos hydrillicola CCALA 1050]MDR9899354.1 DUF2254 domain-containing protein [Aetokthonos hydrillicola Thurmond2011]
MRKFNEIKIRETLRSSYWFVPTLMTGIAIVLAIAMFVVDKAGKYELLLELGWDWCIYNGEPDAALAMLSTSVKTAVAWIKEFQGMIIIPKLVVQTKTIQ